MKRRVTDSIMTSFIYAIKSKAFVKFGITTYCTHVFGCCTARSASEYCRKLMQYYVFCNIHRSIRSEYMNCKISATQIKCWLNLTFCFTVYYSELPLYNILFTLEVIH